MPHLQCTGSAPLADGAVASFADWLATRYAERMDTGTGHVGVTVRDAVAVALGRADPDEPVAISDADSRAGRSAAQRRARAVDVLAELSTRWDIPRENVDVVYRRASGRGLPPR